MPACSSALPSLIAARDTGTPGMFGRLIHRLVGMLGRLVRSPGQSGTAVPPGNLEDEHSATAHMLRTPLTSIRSFSEIMLDNPDLTPEQRARYLAIVVRESERLEKAIDAVLHEEHQDKAA